MNSRARHFLLRASVIAVTALAALLLFRIWGLAGSALLIALWTLAALGFYLMRRRARHLIRRKLKTMNAAERIRALAGLNAQNRAEILEALNGKDR